MKMKFKRLMALLLSVVMILGMMPTAFAAEIDNGLEGIVADDASVIDNGDGSYTITTEQTAETTTESTESTETPETVETLSEIVDTTIDTEAELAAALAAGGTVVLGGNITVATTITVPAGVTTVLDLAGYTITGGMDSSSTTNHIYVLTNRGTLTVNDTVGTGKIVSRGVYNYGSMTLNNGTIDACDGNGGYAVNNEAGSAFVMNGGTLIASNEDDEKGPEGGYDSTALDIPANSTTTLNGGTITDVCDFTYAIALEGTLIVPETSTIKVEGAHGAISMSAGEATINAGTFVCTGVTGQTDNIVYVSGGAMTVNGGTFTHEGQTVDADSGAAVVMDGVNGSLTITDGTFVGLNGTVSGNANTVITGGSYDNVMDYDGWDDVKAYVPAGSVVTVDGETVVKNTDGTTTNVATTYAELATAAAAGKTVVLMADITATGAVDATNAVIDLNGHALTLTVGGNNFFGESTVKNGTINITGCVANGDCIIGIGDYNNSATLNLENVNIAGDGYSSAYAVLYVYNSGTLNITGGSIVVANDNASAGGVIKAHSAANGKINITGTESDPVELTFTDAKIGILDGTVVMDHVDLDIEGGANAINQSALTVKNSTLTIKNCDGRALTLNNGDVSIENSVLDFSGAAEGEIRFKKALTLTADEDSIIKTCDIWTDVAGASINGTAVTGTEAAPEIVTVENGTTTVKTAPKCDTLSYAFTKEVDGYVRVWGEAYGCNAAESFVLKLYSGEQLIATTRLNDVGDIIDGNIPEVTWNFFYPQSNDEYWTTTWVAGHPIYNAQPTKVELYVDGVLVKTNEAQMNGADNVAPVNWIDLGGVTKPVQIGDSGYKTLDEAITAASALTGDVTVEINGKVTMTNSLSGSFDSIKFVGKTDDAEIYLDVQGYITAPGKKVAFEDLTLSKSSGGYITNAGFMNVAFGVYDVAEVTYTDCYFANGAYASSGIVTYTGCTFKRSHDKYGLWAYGNVDVTVDGCIFADYRGIKMYAEGAAKTVNLTVKDTNFTALTGKPAIVLTYGKSVTLEGNTYSSTGVFELDKDGAPNGTTVTADITDIACMNDNYADCGVLVDGKIYTTVTEAAEVAEAGSTVTLMYDSTETVEFVKGVILDKNGHTADGVTVKSTAVSYVAQVGETKYETLAEAVAAADGKTVTLLDNVTLAETVTVEDGKTVIIDLKGKTVSSVVESTLTQSFAMIKNKGTLSIADSVGGGKLSLSYNGEAFGYGVGLYAISNEGGTLNVTGGTVENLAMVSGSMYDAIDNNSTLGDTVLNISGGTVSCGYLGIRQFANSTTGVNTVNVTGGTLVGGNSSIWTQNPGSNQPKANIAVSGGTFTGRILMGESEGFDAAVTGGTFDTDVSEFVADGFVCTESNGTYGVVEVPVVTYVAQVGESKYTDVQQAIVAAAPAGTVEILADVTVDEWVMIAESLTIGNDDLITCVLDGLTINGNGHTLTINSIESAGNGGNLFFDATELNINDLTIKYAAGLAGAIGLKAGTLKNVTFDGCTYGVMPQSGDVVITGCTFKTTGTSIYFEEERDGLTVTGCTFENADTVNVILLRGDVTFTNNTVVSGRTVNVVSGSPIVTGNDFNDVRLKVYNDATATISNNEINVLVFSEESEFAKSTFAENTLSDAAQAALAAVSDIKIYDWEDLKELDALVEGGNMLEGVTVKLMNDIDLYEMGTGGEPVSFNPIGANTSYFKGTFDGQGHTIKNMYQSGWALGYDWYNYGTIGLFAYLWDATVKNLTIENAECFVEGGNVAGIAGCAWGDCTFENITIKDSTYATYNNRAAGIVGYTGGEGTMTFKNVTVDEGTVIAALWGSYDCTLGGVVGSTQSPTVFIFEDVAIACKLDCYNDVTASYKWYSYRMCGMLIGRMNTLQADADTEVDPRGVVTLKNVNITIGEWANQTYIWDDSLSKGCQRVEAGYSYGGVDVSQYPDAEVTSLGFSVIIGGPQSQSKGYYGSDVTKLEALEGFDTTTLTVRDIALEIRSRVAQVGETYYTKLQTAIDEANGEKITLVADVTENITIAEGAAVVIDLGGKILNGYIAPCKPASLTISNGAIVNTASDYSAIEINAGILTLVDVDIASARHGVRIDGAVTTTIEGGEYTLTATSGTRHAVNVSGSANVSIKDGTFVGPKGTTMDSGSAVCVQTGASVLIEGGNFSGGKNATLGVSGTMSITGGAFDQDPSAYVFTGYKAVEKNGTWIVKEDIPLSGTGTAADPYLITSLKELKAFRDSVNEEGKTYAGEYVKLTADIDLTGEIWTPIGTSNYDKTPTTDCVKMFAGNFDGGNHTITGLTSNGYVPDSAETGSTEYSFGLFGYVYGANISNVKLANVDINCGTRTDSTGNAVYGSGVAALIGYYFPADETATVIENCHVLSGTVKASNNMGGLIGHMDSQLSQPKVDITIRDCSNAAAVTTEAREAGGILGLMNSAREGNYYVTMSGTVTFEDCTNTGAITSLGGGAPSAGGILGRDHNQAAGQRLKIVFDGCKNSGTITVTANGETHAAGIGAGYYSTGAWLIAKDCENTGDVIVNTPSSKVYAGGLISYGGVVELINNTSTGAVTGGTAGNTYVGGAQNILFLEKMPNFVDTVNGYTYYLNGGTSPEYAALVDDASGGGNFHLVETAYRDGAEFGGWYDNAELTGEAYTALSSSVKTYYAKWDINYVAKIGEVGYTTLDEAFAAAQNGDEVKILVAGTYALSTSGKDITITGAVDGVVFDNIGAKNMGGASVTFNNVTFDYYPNVNYTGLQHSGDLVYNNCTFNGQVFLYGTSETFNGCTFNQNSSDAYNVWTYSAKVVKFEETTFNSAGKSVLIYHEGATMFNDVAVTDCDFSASAPVDGKAAIEMDSSLTAGINLTIDAATTVTGFGTGNVSGNSLWNNKKGNNTDANNDITVVVDGVTVLAPVTFAAKIGNTGYTTIAAAITAAQAGDTVTVFAGTYDGDLSVNKAITVIGETDAEGNNLVNINGKLSITADGATVKTLNVNNGSSSAGYISAKDVLVEGCSVVGGNGFRYCYTSGTVTFKDSTITGATYGIHFDGKAGGNVVIDNCVITGWTSFAGTIEKVTMTDTTFEEGNYNYIRFYQNAEISGCTFNEKMGVDLAVDGSELTVTDSTVTNGNVEDLFEDRDIVNSTITVDGVKLTRMAKIGDTYYKTFAEALNAVQDGETITLLDVEGSEIGTEMDFTKEISFTITGTAPNYEIPVITFQNATVTIENATFKTAELDARQNATINVVDSTIYDAGGNSIIKSYYNGEINIQDSTVYTMQMTTMGYINISGNSKVTATWQTNVYGNGLITVTDGAEFNTAAIHVTGQDYSGRDNTDADRVGQPATLIVDGATLNVGTNCYAANGANYNYHSSYGFDIGTVAGKAALLDVKNGAVVTFSGNTVTVGADGKLDIAAAVITDRAVSNAGTITLTAVGATLTAPEGLTVGTTVENSEVVYANGVYGVVAKEEAVAELQAFTLSVEDEILLNFKLTIPDEVINDDNSYVKMTRTCDIAGVDKYVIMTAAELRPTKDSSNCYVPTIGMPAPMMTCEVKLEIFDGNGELVLIKDAAGDGSVKNYVSRAVQDYYKDILGNSNAAYNTVKPLLVAMATYGGYAQKQFSHDAANPVYNILPNYGFSVLDISEVTAADMSQRVTTSGNANIGVSYVSQQPALNAALSMKVNFKLTQPVENYTITYTHHEKGASSFVLHTTEVTPIYDASNSRYYVNLDKVEAAYWDYMYDIVFTEKATGESFTISTSILAYCGEKFDQAAFAGYKNLFAAMYVYNQAANKYFGV